MPVYGLKSANGRHVTKRAIIGVNSIVLGDIIIFNLDYRAVVDVTAVPWLIPVHATRRALNI